MNRQSPAVATPGAFREYAPWYDAFNLGKDYAAEAEYVLERTGTWMPSPQSWLDIGCGTGNHLRFLHSRGIRVEGLDISPSMIERARLAHPEIAFHVGSVQGFRLPGARDVISMLFHVMSYQTTDRAIRDALGNVSGHLAPRGVLVFDFWHTDAVLRDPPGTRVREARVGDRRLFRISRPTEDRNLSRVDVHFEFRWDSPEGPLAHQETHALRHFTARELEAFLADAGMSVLTCEGWMQRRPLGPDDWYGLICARSTRRS